MKTLSLVCCLLLTLSSAVEASFPKACQPLKVSGDSVTIKTKKTSLIFIHNRTKTELWLTHPVKNPGASAGWTSRLQAGNWSSLLLNKKSFVLNCIESRPGHEQQVPCEGTIEVCRLTKAKLPDKKSTFWAAEDMSLPALKAAIAARGFTLNEKLKAID